MLELGVGGAVDKVGSVLGHDLAIFCDAKADVCAINLLLNHHIVGSAQKQLLQRESERG